MASFILLKRAFPCPIEQGGKGTNYINKNNSNKNNCNNNTTNRMAYNNFFGYTALLVLYFSCFCCKSLNAQELDMTLAKVPGAGTMRHQGNAFFIYGTDYSFAFPRSAIGKKAEITFSNVSLSSESTEKVRQDIGWAAHASAIANSNSNDAFPHESNPALRLVSPASVEVILMPYSMFNMLGKKNPSKPFCCRSMALGSNIPFEPTEECPYPGAIRRSLLNPKIGVNAATILGTNTGMDLDLEGIYVKPAALYGTPEASETVKFVVKDSGIYLVVIANCGAFPDLSMSGVVTIRNSFGFLPGYEYPNYIYFLAAVCVYAVMILAWMFCMMKEKPNLIKFHYCLLLIAVLGFIESLAKLVNLYYWNNHPIKSYVLFTVSIVLTVLKHICSYILVLLGALGWSITKPTLSRSTVLKLQVIVVLYVILDTVRQISDEYSNASGTFSFLRLVLILLPISALNVTVFYWIYSSLQENIALLTHEKQYEKLLIYRRFFFVLVVALVLAIILLIAQIYFASWDPWYRWKIQGLLTEGFPHTLFIILLLSMMVIWKPHAHSRRLAYFSEIGDNDENDPENNAAMASKAKRATEMRVWGQELEFQDHFSDDYLDDSDALNLNGGIPTYTSVAVTKETNAYPSATVTVGLRAHPEMVSTTIGRVSQPNNSNENSNISNISHPPVEVIGTNPSNTETAVIGRPSATPE